MKDSVRAAIPRVAGRLAVTCWCERKILHVPKQRVLDGLTVSCGEPDCRPADERRSA